MGRVGIDVDGAVVTSATRCLGCTAAGIDAGTTRISTGDSDRSTGQRDVLPVATIAAGRAAAIAAAAVNCTVDGDGTQEETAAQTGNVCADAYDAAIATTATAKITAASRE